MQRVFTVFELLAHDGARGGGDVVGGVLLRVRGRNDGHQVISVGRVHLKHGKTEPHSCLEAVF